MRYERADPGHRRLATVDVETTALEPADGELVSIGVGVHDRGGPDGEPVYDTFHRDGAGEGALVERAMGRLGEADADALVTYNGWEFDLPFVAGRLEALGEPVPLPDLVTSPDRHVDLLRDRKRQADRRGEKWPTLEECLDACGYPRPETRWDGEPVTNSRFGDELGPAYLDALATDAPVLAPLREAVDHYLRTDLEANFAVYYDDIGASFEPSLLGTVRAFSPDSE